MVIGQKLNTLTLKEYFFYIDNHRKYKDFNTLGLYRSIVEHEKLSLEEKLAVRAHAHQYFQKTFDFLQLKDPHTYVAVAHLGEALTGVEYQHIWDTVKRNQQQILADKQFGHRNFGIYAKHDCGYDTCKWNGMMVRQGSWFAECNLHFATDKNKYAAKAKAYRRKSDRKQSQRLIKKALENE